MKDQTTPANANGVGLRTSEAPFAAADGYAALVQSWRDCAKSLVDNNRRLRSFMPDAADRAIARAEIYAQCANRLEEVMRHSDELKNAGPRTPDVRES